MKNKYLIQKLVALLFILVSTGWSVTIWAQNGWKRMEDMNIERIYHRSCLLENWIYVFGGTVPVQYNLSSAEAYDINSNTWISLATMPKTLGDPHVGEINNRIYVVGGIFDESQVTYASDSNYEYNPELDTWSEKENCPLPTFWSPSCTLNNRLYVFGNRKTANNPWYPEKNVFVYDPAVDTWDTLPEMNFEHIDGYAVSLNNKIYLIGGAIWNFPGFTMEGKSEMYDPETNLWTKLEDMPFPVSRHSSIIHDNKILVFGGDSTDYSWDSWHGTNLIQEYDPTTDRWCVMEGMPFNRFASQTQKSGDYVYLIGGEDSPQNRLKETWRFDLNYLKPLSTKEPFHITVPAITLNQNYPNPFSGTTKISYELREPGEVKLDIVNILGQVITTLVYEMKSLGSHSLTWDAAGVGPGIYFCRLRVGEMEKIRKLVVIR